MQTVSTDAWPKNPSPMQGAVVRVADDITALGHVARNNKERYRVLQEAMSRLYTGPADFRILEIRRDELDVSWLFLCDS